MQCDCGDCEICRRRKLDRQRYYRDYEKRRKLGNDLYKSNPQPFKDRAREWEKKNPDKYKAWYTANNDIKQGKLIPQPCEMCGATDRIQKHHDDYSKPLEVRWLCHKHHAELHRKYETENATT